MLSGDKLKFLRFMHGKSQGKVADWCNVSKRYIELIEANKERPSLETYNAFLNCIYGIGEPLPKTPRPNTKKGRELKKNGVQ